MNDVLGVILLISGIFFLMSFLASIGPGVPDPNATKDGVPACPPHEWKPKEFTDTITREKVSRLFCEKCKRFPGQF